MVGLHVVCFVLAIAACKLNINNLVSILAYEASFVGEDTLEQSMSIDEKFLIDDSITPKVSNPNYPQIRVNVEGITIYPGLLWLCSGIQW